MAQARAARLVALAATRNLPLTDAVSRLPAESEAFLGHPATIFPVSGAARYATGVANAKPIINGLSQIEKKSEINHTVIAFNLRHLSLLLASRDPRTWVGIEESSGIAAHSKGLIGGLLFQLLQQLLRCLPQITRATPLLRRSDHIRRQRRSDGGDLLADDVLEPA